MDLWNTYSKRDVSTYGTEQLRLATGPRHHASIAQVVDRAVTLDPGKATLMRYSEERRYVVAKDLTFDLLVSIYGVDTKCAAVARICNDMNGKDLARIRGWMAKSKDSNVELRAIGLQNSYPGAARSIDLMRKGIRTRLMELDLFGADMRHIALDLKTGVPYNLLLLNRVYRPGELACQQKKDDFISKASDLVFI